MKKKSFENYIYAHLTAIGRELVNYAKRKNPEQIHRLRVHIKKLRAFLSFLNKTCEKNIFPKKVFKELFDKAGELRELHININLLKKFPNTQKSLHELQKKEKELQRQFIRNQQKFLIVLNEFSGKIKLPEKFPGDKEVKKYFHKQIKKSETLLSHKKDKAAIHHFRMRIKKTMYVYNSLPKKIRKSIALNESYIDELQERAGNWHDTYSAVNFFTHIQSMDSSNIEKLIRKEEKQFDLLLQYCKDLKKNIYS